LCYPLVPTYLIVGLLIVFLTGLIDDLIDLSPSYKLLGQSLGSLILVLNGLFLDIPLLPIWVSQIVSFIWILGLLNAINFVDGLDGLASGFSIISLVSVLICVSVLGIVTSLDPIYILIFCIFGFLIFNAYPSNIFLGDNGSLGIGFLLIYFVLSSLSEIEHGWLVCPIILLFPIVDMVNVVVRRYLKKCNIFSADKRHFHHMLYNFLKKKDHTHTVSILYIVMIVTSILIPVLIISS
jgi:UDP-GlcNAc:undecaprenyl-phosphate GlcNAc-1-phosphate transferase